MRRPAFTLLEVLCSLAISVLLLSALYVAVNVQLQSTQTAREVIEHSTLVRTLVARISSDIRANLGPVPPDPSRTATSGTTTSTTSSTSTTTTTTTSSSTTTTGSGSATSTSTLGPVQINLGVQGDSARLTLYISRIHRDPRFLPELSSGPDAMTVSSDLRRVTYWLAGSPEAPLGLARQVVRLVTAEDLMSLIPPDGVDEAAHILADEVRSLRFSYFDGASWQDSWDGTVAGADGVTPVGPPAAIAIVLGIARHRDGNGEGNVREYRHVVLIPTANGASQQTTGSATGSP